MNQICSKQPLLNTLRVGVLALGLVSVDLRAGVVSAFETAEEIKAWTFNKGGEFPGARGAFVFSGGAANGDHYGELRYDFTPPSPLPEKFNPHYVQVLKSLKPAESEGAARIRLRASLSQPDVQIYLRWIDATGQSFQGKPKRNTAVGADASGLAEFTMDLDSPAFSWGGAKDGVVHLPLKKIAVVCDATGLRNTGWLRFDDLELLGREAASADRVATLVINNFSAADEIAQWRFNNGGEFPGARGAIVSGAEARTQKPYAELRYDFTPPSPLPANFDPHYVQASRALSAAEAAASTSRIRFQAQMSRPDLVMNFRWTDASGQTLQKKVSSSERLEQTTPSLHAHSVDVQTADMHWGGANDGVTRFPIKSVAIICEATGFRDAGWIRFTDLSFLPEEIATLDSFDAGTEFSVWRFNNGGEFPGARGGIQHIKEPANSWARLSYDFSKPAEWIGAFDPHYVEAWRPLPAEVRGVRIRFAVSSGDIAVRLRYKDSAGQTFQTTLTHGLATEGIAANTWVERAHAFAPAELHWGGPNDGVVRFPIKRLGLILEAKGRRDAGHLKFDDVAFTHREIPVIALESAPLVTPAWGTGSLQQRSGVNIPFVKDDRAMDAIAAAGFGWIRKDVHWDHIETKKGVYNFDAFDALVAAAERRGLWTMAILDYGNKLHTGGAMTPPRTPAALNAFENLCTAIAARYAGRKVAFEVWNEPDVAGFWAGAPNALEFGALLKKGISGVKRGNPDATVITGGLSSLYDVTYKFLNTQLATGSMKGASGMGMHLYGTAFPEKQWGALLGLKKTSADETGGELWCSEWGFSSSDLSPFNDGREPVGRHIQASMAVRQLLMGWWANLPIMVLYDIRDDGSNPAEAMHNYGLLAEDYSEKPAMKAVKTLLSASHGRVLAGLLVPPTLPEGVHIARLDGSNDKVYIIWTEESADESGILIEAGARATDMYGQPVTTVQSGNHQFLNVRTGQGPVYVTISNQ